MHQLIHYTSYENWKSIQKKGWLLPKSTPLDAVDDGLIEISDKVKDIIVHPAYLVGIPRPLHEGWINYGVMVELLLKTTDEVVLNVPILNRHDTFIREHKYLSPKWFLEHYNKNLNKFHIDDPEIKNLLYQYFITSVVRLDEYDETYKVPEIWCPQETPIDLIERIK